MQRPTPNPETSPFRTPHTVRGAKSVKTVAMEAEVTAVVAMTEAVIMVIMVTMTRMIRTIGNHIEDVVAAAEADPDPDLASPWPPCWPSFLT